jgi:hypothetical protein
VANAETAYAVVLIVPKGGGLVDSQHSAGRADLAQCFNLQALRIKSNKGRLRRQKAL